MADRIYYVDEDITLDLGREDLGHPNLPGLWDVLLAARPWGKGHFQCIECQSLDPGDPQWMFLREQNGKRQSVHLNPGTRKHSAPVGPKHRALQERIARAAEQRGFAADIEERTSGGDIRSDVLIRGAEGMLLGCEVQISHQTAERTRARSENSRQHGITPLWTTVNPKAHLINQAPWTRIDNQPPEMLRSGNQMLVRGGARELVMFRCDHTLPRPCPVLGRGRCGGLHLKWDLKHGLMFDDLIGLAAAKDWVPLERPKGRGSEWMWVSAADRERLRDARARIPEKVQKEKEERKAEANDRVCSRGQDLGFRAAPARRRDTGSALVEAVTYNDDLSQRNDPAVDLWLSSSTGREAKQPCTHYIGTEYRRCGATPSRAYAQGRRCTEHAPSAMANRQQS